MSNKFINIILGFAIGLSISIRFIIPWNIVFKNNQVVFTEVDPYLYMRKADTIIHNWQSNFVDPYLAMNVPAKPTFAWILSILSFGNTQWLDTVSALFPAVCGILLIIPMYFIAKKLFGNIAALLSALFIATVPGDMLARTSLGFTDHHCLEILLVTSIICCLIYSIKGKLFFSVISGLLLGSYYAIWIGAPILSVLLDIYIIFQGLIDLNKKNDNINAYWSLCITNFIALCTFIIIPFNNTLSYYSYLIVLAISVLVPVFIYLIIKLLKGLSVLHYIIILIAVCILILKAIDMYLPNTFTLIRTGLQIVSTSNINITETESMTFQVLWNNLGLISVFGLTGIVLLCLKDFRNNLLIIVWTIFMLVLAVMQRRFIYYLTPSMIICCVYTIWLLGQALVNKYQEVEKKKIVITSIIIFLMLIIIPNTIASGKQNRISQFSPTNAWLSACDWLRYNTQLPFETEPTQVIKANIPYDIRFAYDNGTIYEDSKEKVTLIWHVYPDYYYQIYDNLVIAACSDSNIEQNIANINYINQEKNYRILTWWDYGYWILRISQRPVLCNPGGGDISDTASILSSNKEETAILLKTRTRYIVIDYTMIGLKWPAIQDHAYKISDDSSRWLKASLMYKLYSEQKLDHWKKVWESKEKYGKDSQVKIFEYTEYK
jgi:asparagine N-glycosylation enzyme membrane subunit Stt3